VFDLNNNFSRIILGVFVSFISLGSIAGVAILFLSLTFWVLIGIFVLNGLIYFLLESIWNENLDLFDVSPICFYFLPHTV
jgi:uncharacterized membrane protein YcaP (DUF421 family)